MEDGELKMRFDEACPNPRMLADFVCVLKLLLKNGVIQHDDTIMEIVDQLYKEQGLGD